MQRHKRLNPRPPGEGRVRAFLRPATQPDCFGRSAPSQRHEYAALPGCKVRIRRRYHAVPFTPYAAAQALKPSPTGRGQGEGLFAPCHTARLLRSLRSLATTRVRSPSRVQSTHPTPLPRRAFYTLCSGTGLNPRPPGEGRVRAFCALRRVAHFWLLLIYTIFRRDF